MQAEDDQGEANFVIHTGMALESNKSIMIKQIEDVVANAEDKAEQIDAVCDRGDANQRGART